MNDNWMILERSAEPLAEPLFWRMGFGFASFETATRFDGDEIGLEIVGLWLPEEVAERLHQLWLLGERAIQEAGYGLVNY